MILVLSTSKIAHCVAAMWAVVHLVRGEHVIQCFRCLIEDFFTQATFDLRRFASVLRLDVRTQARFGKPLVTRNAEVWIAAFFLFIIIFQKRQGVKQILQLFLRLLPLLDSFQILDYCVVLLQLRYLETRPRCQSFVATLKLWSPVRVGHPCILYPTLLFSAKE